MTFTSSANELAREIRSACEQLNRQKQLWEELVRSYHGRAWDDAGGEANPAYSTFAYEYISLMVPKLVQQNPRFTLDTTRGGRQLVITKALERGLNHWAQSSRLHEPLEQIALDALFMVGGGYIEEVPNKAMRLTDEQKSAMKGSLRRPKTIAYVAPEDAEQPFLPKLRRLQPFRFFWDLAATSEEGIRFAGHKVTEDKNDLLARAKADKGDWDVKAIEAMKTSRAHQELGYAHSNVPERNQVTYEVVWVPDAKIEGVEPEADEHGVIYTIACDMQTAKGDVTGAFIRNPYYFYGPPQGPYVRVGFYSVPGSTLPLSPLVATRDASEILGRVHRAMVKRVERYRKGAMYDLKDKRDVDRIRESEDMDLVGVTGFDGNLKPFELGGISAQDIEHHRFLLERLQTSSGMDDVQRGNVTGSGTATEVAIASEGSQERVSFMIGKWRQFVADVAMRVAWYAGHDDRVVFSYRVEEDQRQEIAEEALAEGMIDPQSAEVFMRDGSMTFAGGDFKDGNDDGLLFGDLSFDVEPYSMQRRDQRTRKMDTLEALNVMSTFGAAAMQGVPIDFGKVAEILADVYALPELEDIVNRRLAQAQGILSMEERVAAMAKDTAAGPGAAQSGGQAKPARSERAAPPKSAPRQMQKGLM